mmetsp:Transcript_12987/g.28079  ORF Transcript_12987/g.28079 Transcript_12987/m.28079 type:complete len:90 (-) Transcript_12987:722-991(-)|eukprot:4726212-Pleurochrysis_carterae.AAC.1
MTSAVVLSPPFPHLICCARQKHPIRKNSKFGRGDLKTQERTRKDREDKRRLFGHAPGGAAGHTGQRKRATLETGSAVRPPGEPNAFSNH